MHDLWTLAAIAGFALVWYAVENLDPNVRTPGQARREAMDARRRQRARDGRRVEQESGEGR